MWIIRIELSDGTQVYRRFDSDTTPERRHAERFPTYAAACTEVDDMPRETRDRATIMRAGC